jgi:glutaredoxin
MRMKSAIFGLVCILTLPALAQQLYKWVGPDGKIVYSDQPPPANIKKVENRNLGNATATDNLPPELAAAVKKNPVSLYTAADCTPCTEVRSYLKSNGVPFAEKTVASNEDINKLTQVSGETKLPFMLVGSKRLLGLDKSEIRTALTKAGYPETNKLPADYRYPAAEPAAPPPAPVVKEKPANPAAAPASASTPSEPAFRF